MSPGCGKIADPAVILNVREVVSQGFTAPDCTSQQGAGAFVAELLVYRV